MAKRVALTSLLPSTSAALEPEAPPRTAEPAPAPTAATAPATADSSREIALTPVRRPVQSESSTPTGSRARRPSRPTDAVHQHYSQLTRKEARLRDDQIDDLATQARRLSRAKSNTDERITDNTLIRIAVDLLLADPSRLQGSTEAELRNSVGL